MRAMPIRYEKFEKKMLDVMIQKEYKPDIDDRLRQAFLVSGVWYSVSSLAAGPCDLFFLTLLEPMPFFLSLLEPTTRLLTSREKAGLTRQR